MSGEVSSGTSEIRIGKHFEITSEYRRLLEFFCCSSHSLCTLGKSLKRSVAVNLVIHQFLILDDPAKLSEQPGPLLLFGHDALQFAVTKETRLFPVFPLRRGFQRQQFDRKVKTTVFAFILEGLGSTELLLILAVALIFFGPRKLPQLARSMGKGLAEFRKASDDFKRTWEREVALETSRLEEMTSLETNEQSTYEASQTQTTNEASQTLDEPVIETPNSELVVPRDAENQTTSDALAEPIDVSVQTTQPEPQPVRKQEWL
jgi:TatA/E family protein of Tat protein translocase